jgi:hypothetical protein
MVLLIFCAQCEQGISMACESSTDFMSASFDDGGVGAFIVSRKQVGAHQHEWKGVVNA